MTGMTLKVLSPLHIGNGRELTPLDIYPGDGVVYVLDTGKLTADLIDMGISLEEILHLLKNPPGDAYVWKGYIDELHLNPSDYALYTLRIHGEPGRRSMQIKEFIKLNGKPYIPGSSVKGALRTAVLYKVLKECGDSGTAMNVVSRIKSKRGQVERKTAELAREIGWSESLVDFYLTKLPQERTDGKHADDLLEAIVFGMESDRRSGVKYEPKRDPMRALIVRDSAEIGKKHLAVYHVDVIGNVQPIPIWVEALEPGTTAEIEVKVDTELLRLNSEYFNGVLWECLRDWGRPWEVFETFLWEAVEEFYTAVRKAEMAEARKFGTKATEGKRFYSSLEGHGGHVLRIGWGSGWLAMTIGVLLRENRRWEGVRRQLGLGRKPGGRGLSRDFPKTRRLAKGMPMGWVVLE